MRTFETGATRDTDAGKLDYDGFLSPLALERFAQYMHKHRLQADGSMRASDNWKKGIPFEAYRKSKWRHDVDFWRLALENATGDEIEDALCAVLFNVQGYLHELVKARQRSAATLLADARAREQGVNLDGSPRRETVLIKPRRSA